MKMIIVVALALVAATVAAPTNQQEEVVIVKSVNERTPDGGYELFIETSDGVIRNEKGELKQVQNEDGEPVKVVVVSGSYTQPGVNGPVTTNFVANENGYEADGPLIPQVLSTDYEQNQRL